MAKNNNEMYKIYELKDSLSETLKSMNIGVGLEQQLIDLVESSNLKGTDFAKQLIEQTKNDINARAVAKPKLQSKLEACGALTGMYEKQSKNGKAVIDEVLRLMFIIIGGVEE